MPIRSNICSFVQNMLQSNLYSIFYPYFRKQFKTSYMPLSNLRTLFHLLTGILAAVCLLACDAKEPLPENQNTEIESPVIANDLSNQKSPPWPKMHKAIYG